MCGRRLGARVRGVVKMADSGWADRDQHGRKKRKKKEKSVSTSGTFHARTSRLSGESGAVWGFAASLISKPRRGFDTARIVECETSWRIIPDPERLHSSACLRASACVSIRQPAVVGIKQCGCDRDQASNIYPVLIVDRDRKKAGGRSRQQPPTTNTVSRQNPTDNFAWGIFRATGPYLSAWTFWRPVGRISQSPFPPTDSRASLPNDKAIN